MRIFIILLLTAALALAGFAAWGLLTSSGNRAFDEMDGLIPFGAALLSPVFGLAAGTAWLVARRWR